jgi:septal ring factor EnvC (AmiA/AmiB activator)
MARSVAGLLALTALLLMLGVGLSGCGPKPPCQGATVTQVQSAQDECAAAEDGLQAVREERAGLEAELAQTKSELAELEGRPAELGRRLHDLRKGSGR